MWPASARKWTGVGDYDVIITLSKQEMAFVTEHYGIDWSFFTKLPAKSYDGNYFLFASLSRKALALLPFLSLAFGGMYFNLPMASQVQDVFMHSDRSDAHIPPAAKERAIIICLDEFTMEEFRMTP